LVFRCDRGEIGFKAARRIRPYFRERADWRFIEGLISAHLRESTKFFRGDFITACRGARTLADVYNNIKTKLAKTKEGSFVHKVYTELDQYFSEVLPTLKDLDLSSTLDLGPGVNLIDLEGIPLATQQLIISSCAEYLLEKTRDTILVVPEAWQMIPQDRGSPVKLAVEAITRKGAKLGVYCFLDSQQLTGVDLGILRNVGVWLFGRQTLDREMDRVVKMIQDRKVKAEDIGKMEIGYFYVRQYGDSIRKVYVCPAWLDEQRAKLVALGSVKVKNVKPPMDVVMALPPEDPTSPMAAENERLRLTVSAQGIHIQSMMKEMNELRDRIAEFERGTKLLREGMVSAKSEAVGLKPAQAPIANIPAALDPYEHREKWNLTVTKTEPELTVKVRVHKVAKDETDNIGRMAILLSEGLFDQPAVLKVVITQFLERGWWKAYGGPQATAARSALGEMTKMGFLRCKGTADDGPWLVEERMRKNVVKEESG
jgi:hypothetical protein